MDGKFPDHLGERRFLRLCTEQSRRIKLDIASKFSDLEVAIAGYADQGYAVVIGLDVCSAAYDHLVWGLLFRAKTIVYVRPLRNKRPCKFHRSSGR